MNLLDNITLLTCSFNNNLLTCFMIKSLFKWLKREIPVVIIDNGTVKKCTEEMKEVFTVIDNTNFNITKNYHQVSRNHCASIDYALKNCINTKYVMLCDNDILFKPDIKNLFDFLETQDFDCVGDIIKSTNPREISRISPFFCIFSIEKFKNCNLNYFDEKRCMNHCITIFNKNNEYNGRKIINSNCKIYDTGASFKEDIEHLNWNFKKINQYNFITHLASASWGKDKKNTYLNWLKANKKLYD